MISNLAKNSMTIDVMVHIVLIMFPSTWLVIQLNSGKVVAVGQGARDRDGKVTPVNLKEGEVVLLPEYGGTEVKLADKE